MVASCSRSKSSPAEAGKNDGKVDAGTDAATVSVESDAKFSAPIAGLRLPGGDIIVAGLDVAASGVRARRVAPNGQVRVERIILEDVRWSPDAELKLLPSDDAVVLYYRGRRDGKPSREVAVVSTDLQPRVRRMPVGSASCSTQHAFIHAQSGHLRGLSLTRDATPYVGPELPSDREVSLACGAQRAFVMLESENGVDIVFASPPRETLEGPKSKLDASATAELPFVASKPRPWLRDAWFADEARERAEYVAGDDLGVVRIGAHGSLSVSETRGDEPLPVRKLQATVAEDDDVVAVDASPKSVVVVVTQDASESCAQGTGSSTRVKALRFERQARVESALALSSGTCGREIGPFFTSVASDGIHVAWVERVPVVGRSRPSIASIMHVLVTEAGEAKPSSRLDVSADAVTDAGCDASDCSFVVLERSEGGDPMAPGRLRVVRFTP